MWFCMWLGHNGYVCVSVGNSKSSHSDVRLTKAIATSLGSTPCTFKHFRKSFDCTTFWRGWTNWRTRLVETQCFEFNVLGVFAHKLSLEATNVRERFLKRQIQLKPKATKQTLSWKVRSPDSISNGAGHISFPTIQNRAPLWDFTAPQGHHH